MNPSSSPSLSPRGGKAVIGGRGGRGIYILIAPGFDEEFVASFLSQMRAAGLKVRLVGTSAGLISGQRGLTVRPDCSLNQLELQTEAPGLILLPGNLQAASELAADPRVHQLIRLTLRQSGYVAMTRTAESVLAAQPPFSGVGVVPQGDLDSHEFISQLVKGVAE